MAKEWRDERFAELDRLIAAEEAHERWLRVKASLPLPFRFWRDQLTARQIALIRSGVPESFFEAPRPAGGRGRCGSGTDGRQKGASIDG